MIKISTILMLTMISLTSIPAIADSTTYYSDGSSAQTYSNGDGDSTTYFSDGSNAQTYSDEDGSSTTYYSDGSSAQTYNN